MHDAAEAKQLKMISKVVIDFLLTIIIPTFTSYFQLYTFFMLNSAFYNSLLHWPQKEDETEKTAFINPISAIKPVTGNLARTAFGGAKNLLKDSWKGLSGIDKTLTVGLPLATTVPSLFNKKDQMGNSRANRLSSTAGNIIGGIAGTGLGNQLAKKVTTKLPGFAGKALGLGASVVGGLSGSLLGEAAAKTPFKAFNSSPTQSYNTQPSTSAPQMSMPGQTVS